VAFDPHAPLGPDEPFLLFPNTTTLVDVVLNRIQSDKLLVVKDSRLQVISAPSVARVATAPTGRAELMPQK
jgi:hypothetical protein